MWRHRRRCELSGCRRLRRAGCERPWRSPRWPRRLSRPLDFDSKESCAVAHDDGAKALRDQGVKVSRPGGSARAHRMPSMGILGQTQSRLPMRKRSALVLAGPVNTATMPMAREHLRWRSSRRGADRTRLSHAGAASWHRRVRRVFALASPPRLASEAVRASGDEHRGHLCFVARKTHFMGFLQQTSSWRDGKLRVGATFPLARSTTRAVKRCPQGRCAQGAKDGGGAVNG